MERLIRALANKLLFWRCPPVINIYLAGPIESKNLHDHGTTWRQRYSEDLAKLGQALRLRFMVFDPSREEAVIMGSTIASGKRQKDDWRRQAQYKLFNEKMTQIINMEFGALDASDYVIERWPNEIPSTGTRDEELRVREKIMIPLGMVIIGDPAELNRWKHCRANELGIEIFYTWSQLLASIARHYGNKSWMRIRLEQLVRRSLVRWRLSVLWLARKLMFAKALTAFPAHYSSDAFRGAYKEARNVRDGRGNWIVPHIIFHIGPPNSGKSTISQNLAKALPGLAHIETSDLIKRAFNERANDLDAAVEFEGKVYSIAQEKEVFDSGRLNETDFVLALIREKMLSLSKPCRGIVFSGSPRRDIEAKKLIPMIEELFPYFHLTVFQLEVSPTVALSRAQDRGRAEGFDTPEKQKERQAIFDAETRPALDWLAKNGYPAHVINTSDLTPSALLEQELDYISFS